MEHVMIKLRISFILPLKMSFERTTWSNKYTSLKWALKAQTSIDSRHFMII